MANPEKLNKSELSEEEKVIRDSQEKVEDLKDELPVTKEEAEEMCEFFEWFMAEMDKVTRPIAVLKEGIERWINDAKAAWYLKRDEKEQETLKTIIRKIMSEENSENLKNIIVKDEEIWEYYMNPDWIFNLINSLDKKDRKFIKKVVKAIIKADEKNQKEHIRTEKKRAKEVKKARKELIVNRIK